MNLFFPKDEQASVPMHTNCTSPKENRIKAKASAEQYWISIVSELVIILVSDEHEIISSLKPQAISSELDRAS